MEFLRDVIIATGKCKGLNLGRNHKRGGPEISRDFIVYRSNTGKDGRDRGVDIASGYDDTQNHAQADVAGLRRRQELGTSVLQRTTAP